MRNLFSAIIKQKYRALNMRGRHLATSIGCSPSSLSQYLSGDVRMPAPALDALVRHLGFTEAEAAGAKLAHDLLHIPKSVRGYIARLEQHRMSAEACSRYLSQLGMVITDMERSREESMGVIGGSPGGWTPLVHEPPGQGPGMGSSSVHYSIPSTDDDGDDEGSVDGSSDRISKTSRPVLDQQP